MVFGLRDGFGEVQDPDRLNAALPPPPYAPPELVDTFISNGTRTTRAEVITTTTTTTTTTTQTTTVIHPNSRVTAGPLGEGPHLPPFLIVDKELPPIPLPRTNSVSFDLPGKPGIPRPSFSRSVSALACTSLEIGSSHAGHSNLPMTFFGSRTNTFSMAQSPNPLTTEIPRSESHQAFPSSDDDNQIQLSQEEPLRRSRGVSFGALSFLSLASPDSKSRAKAAAQDKHAKAQRSPHPSPKILSRKPSFWRKNKPPELLDASHPQYQAATPVVVSQAPPQLPPLPDTASFSSLGTEDISRRYSTIHNAFDLPNNMQSLVNTRRHSAESLSIRFSTGPSIVPQPSQKRPSQTPATAPVETLPLPTLSFELTEEPSSIPPFRTINFPQIEDGGPHEFIERHNTRRRAQTNPLALSHNPNTPTPASQSSTSLLSGIKNANPTKVSIPKPSTDAESPNVYLSRVRSVVSKGELASVLASSSEPIYTESLRAYLREFDFRGEPLDIALRKLLMEVGLPRETQQIDRVVEAFSFRYSECNPDLFSSDDHAYILAFSLIMLHTDAFNKSNRSKMSKADYVKNASLPGTFPDVLACFYDNITFSPFIFIEDPLDINGQPGIPADALTRGQHTLSTPTTASILTKNKIDPYYLIANNFLESMAADVEKIIPLDDPFSFEGTASSWDSSELQAAFSNARLLQVEVPQHRPCLSTSVSGDPGSASLSRPNGIDGLSDTATPNTMTLKVTKAGVLNRKDDITGRGKRAAMRKWKPWSVVLTGSQMLFFRDTKVAAQLDPSDSSNDLAGGVFRPDDIISVKDAIALYDKSYSKHDNAFRFVLQNGRQILFQAQDCDDMNTWLSRINYASAFKSAGVRVRPVEMSRQDVHLVGVAAATSHLHDLETHEAPISTPSRWDSTAPRELMGMLSGIAFGHRPKIKYRLTIPCNDLLDLDNVAAIQSAKTEQFERTFKRVKSDLARAPSPENSNLQDETPMASPLDPSSPSHSRYDIIQQKLQELETKLSAVDSELQSHMRFLRNIAILRPLQKATRVKLQHVVQSFVASKKLTSLRVDSRRLTCHIMVLRDDLEAEASSFDAMKSIALNAAKQTLKQRQDSPNTRELADRSQGLSPSHDLMRHLSDASLADSFHSAMEYGPDWPYDDSSTTRTPTTFNSSRLLPHDVSDDVNNSGSTAGLKRSSSFSSSTGGSQRELDSSPTLVNPDEAEEAEPWNRTRAAKRVSLIRVPSIVAFSKRTSNQAAFSTSLDS